MPSGNVKVGIKVTGKIKKAPCRRWDRMMDDLNIAAQEFVQDVAMSTGERIEIEMGSHYSNVPDVTACAAAQTASGVWYSNVGNIHSMDAATRMKINPDVTILRAPIHGYWFNQEFGRDRKIPGTRNTRVPRSAQENYANVLPMVRYKKRARMFYQRTDDPGADRSLSKPTQGMKPKRDVRRALFLVITQEIPETRNHYFGYVMQRYFKGGSK